MWKKQNTHSSISQVRKTMFLSLRLPNLIINNYEIQREKSIKLLGVLLDQHVIRIEHIKRTGNIIAKIHRYMQNHGGDALIEHI